MPEMPNNAESGRFTIAVDIKSILFVIAVMGPLSGLIMFGVRQSVALQAVCSR